MIRRQVNKTPQKAKMQKPNRNTAVNAVAPKVMKKAKAVAEDVEEEVSNNVGGNLINKLPKKKNTKVDKNKQQIEEEVEDFAVEEEDVDDNDAEDEGLSGDENIEDEEDMLDDDEDFGDDDNAEEEDEENEENEDNEENMEAEDEEDEDENGNENEEENESSAKATKVQTGKKALKTKANKPTVGKITKDYPLDKIIRIKNIPKKCKTVDIIELFTEYGAVHGIRILGGKQANVAELAFKTTEAATNAAAASGNIKAQSNPLSIQIKKDVADVAGKKVKNKHVEREGEERRVYVRNLKLDTDKDELMNFFSSCGNIVKIDVNQRNKSTSAVIEFENKESKAKALEMHNSALNDTNIAVYDTYNWKSKEVNKRDPNHTITLKNTQQLNCVDSNKLTSCFANCGEIVNMELICGKNILGFITFKTEEAAAKAMNLNGKTKNGIQLDIEKYNPGSRKVSVHVSNIAKGVTQEDLENLFSTCGEISSIVIKAGFAVIHFATPEAYCKSFLLTESNLKGQMIFLEPFSPKKKFIMKKLINRKRKFSERNPKQNGFKKQKHNF